MSSAAPVSGGSKRRATSYVRRRCPSTILDKYENRARSEQDEPPRSRTRAGQRVLVEKLNAALESAAKCEADYRANPPRPNTKERIAQTNHYRDFSVDFCNRAPDWLHRLIALSDSNDARESRMAAERANLTELERSSYRLEMALPEPQSEAEPKAGKVAAASRLRP